MLGALISAGSSLLGGLLGQKAQKQNAQNQIMFAKNQLQWKAADAKKAGISKLFAMGAPTLSYQPSSVGGSLGSSVADAGQHIGRALEAQSSPAGRAGGLALELSQAQLEGLKIDNDIKRQELLSKVALRNQPGQPPAINDRETTPVIPGQGNSVIKLQKQMSAAQSETTPQSEFGMSPEIRWYRTKTGWAPEVPQDLGEAQESQPLSAAQWFIRNKIMPNFGMAHRTFPYEAPPGMYWRFNPLFGEYQLRALRGTERFVSGNRGQRP